MNRNLTLALATAATFAVASPAQAALTITQPCSVTQVSPTANSCAGWVDKNILGNSASQIAQVQEALAILGFNWDGVTVIKNIGSGNSAGVIDFGVKMSGLTIIGVHRGGNGDGTDPGNATAFFRWDNLSQTDKIQLNISGLSGHTLYTTTVVPEPATWLLMIAGIGLMGWQLRRRRQTVKVSYA
jgi:hypothetical protein